MEGGSMILVLGELIKDEFIYCSADRLSPEACCPVMKELFTETNRGGAANVANNLDSLGSEGVIFVHQENDIVKTRYVHKSSGHHILRLDKEEPCKPLTIEKLMQNFPFGIDEVKMVVISDYCKGFITEDFICEIGKLFPCDIIIDTKKKAGEWISYVNFIKINKKEFEENFEPFPMISNLLKTTHLFVTLGEKGVLHFNTNSITKTEEKEAICVSGAGDSYLAGFVHKYLDCNNIDESLEFANKVASVAVSKRGVVAVKKGDIYDT